MISTSLVEIEIKNLKLKELSINNTSWRYSTCGSGKKTLLMILSNIGGTITPLPIAEMLQHDFNLVMLSVPAVNHFNDIVNGLLRILEEEGIEKCDIYGHSMGSCYLQSFVNKYPQVIGKVIYSHASTIIRNTDKHTINKKDIIIFTWLKRLLPIIPLKLAMNKVGGEFIKHLTLSTSKGTEYAKHLLQNEISKITKVEIRTIMTNTLYFMDNYQFSPNDYRDIPNILIIDSKDDSLVSEKQRNDMLLLCPNAKLHRFETGGHITMFTRKDEYLKLLKDFLLEKESCIVP